MKSVTGMSLIKAALFVGSWSLLAACPSANVEEDRGTLDDPADSALDDNDDATNPGDDATNPGDDATNPGDDTNVPVAALETGAPCNVLDDRCGTGKVCFEAYQGGSTCFETCTTPGAVKDGHGPALLEANCLPISANQNLWVVQSGNLGPCGNVVNAVCEQGVCLGDGEPYSVGACGIICSPANPGTCSTPGLPPEVCGCGADLECSGDVRIGEADNADGVCTAPTSVGDPCGQVGTSLNLCGTGQACALNPATGAGECQVNETEATEDDDGEGETEEGPEAPGDDAPTP